MHIVLHKNYILILPREIWKSQIMQKIKNFFKFITNKEFLVKIILIQVIMLLFVIMTGNSAITIRVRNSNYYSSFKVDGNIDTEVSGHIDTSY